ncbi:DUF4219 domain-containing protein [Tanacetum coccineum]
MDSDKYLEGQSMQRPPLFESDSFIYWKNRFETYVKSKDLDLWHVITNGDFQPIIQNPKTKLDEVIPFEKQTDDLKKRLAKNNEAKMVIYNALPRKEYERIFMCNTEKEIWKTLYGYIKNHKKIVKNRQARTRESEEYKKKPKIQSRSQKSQIQSNNRFLDLTTLLEIVSWSNLIVALGLRTKLYPTMVLAKSMSKTIVKQEIMLKQTKIDAHSWDSPLEIDLTVMSKDETWITGQGIGRYWLGAEALCNHLCCTSAYTVPEVLSRTEYDGKTAAVWSCGVTLYLMLVGACSFEDQEDPKNFKKTIQRIMAFQCKIPYYVHISQDRRHLLSRIFVPNAATITMFRIEFFCLIMGQLWALAFKVYGETSVGNVREWGLGGDNVGRKGSSPLPKDL